MEKYVISGVAITTSVILLNKLFGSSRACKEMNKTIKEKYNFRLESLEFEISLLERDVPGQSIFDDNYYRNLVLKSFRRYSNEIINRRIPKDEVEILGDDFLKEYEFKARRFLELMSRYQN